MKQILDSCILEPKVLRQTSIDCWLQTRTLALSLLSSFVLYLQSPFSHFLAWKLHPCWYLSPTTPFHIRFIFGPVHPSLYPPLPEVHHAHPLSICGLSASFTLPGLGLFRHTISKTKSTSQYTESIQRGSFHGSLINFIFHQVKKKISNMFHHIYQN